MKQSKTVSLPFMHQIYNNHKTLAHLARKQR